MITNVMSKRIFWGAQALAAALAFGAPAAQASCVPTVAANWTVPVTISTINTAGVVSYTAGYLNGSTSGALSGGGSQYFSDRTYGCPSGQLCNPAPFSAPTDNLGVAITGKNSGAITVTMTLASWGNGKFSFTGYCDSKTNLLYSSVSWPPNTNNTMVEIRFGTPYSLIIK